MDDLFIIFIAVGTLLFLLTILIVVFYVISSKKKLLNIKEELSLIEGNKYEILQNGGKTIKDLVFVSIYYGNHSANGNVNLLFHKKSKYRESYVIKEVIIKYGSIWKITNIDS